jgi:hypothetical protein
MAPCWLDSRPRFTPICSLTAQGPSDLRGGIRPYALTDHIHERESAFRLSTLPSSPSPFSLAFVPNVAPWFSGIISVLTAPLNQSMRASNVVELYEQQYSGERMCIVGKGVPDVTEAEGRHGWRMGGVQVHSSGKRVVVVVSQVKVIQLRTALNTHSRARSTTSSKVRRPSACRTSTSPSGTTSSTASRSTRSRMEWT